MSSAETAPPHPTPAGPPPAPPASPSPTVRPRSTVPRGLMVVVVVLALVVAGWFAYGWIQYRLSHSITDDAFVEAHIINIAPQAVSGHIVRFLVEENDKVQQGQVLAE